VKKLTVAVLLSTAAISQTSPKATPKPTDSVLEKKTVFAVYGRGFGMAPILGHLGTYKDIDAMAADLKTRVPGIATRSGRDVIPALDLVYSMAVPCKGTAKCLEYLDQGTIDVAAKYIKAAASRGWLVILDTQLGNSDPVTEVKRMIDKGYLKYDNVHVAIDPEFHLVPGHSDPGIPIGTVTAAQINDVQELLDRYVRSEGLKTRRILIVHQFGDAAVHDGVPYMISNKKALKQFHNVDLVIDADGLGGPAEKIRKYNLMTDNITYPAVHFGGIKVFYPNPWEHAGHYDKPPLSLDQVFGLTALPGGLRIKSKPNVFIIA